MYTWGHSDSSTDLFDVSNLQREQREKSGIERRKRGYERREKEMIRGEIKKGRKEGRKRESERSERGKGRKRSEMRIVKRVTEVCLFRRGRVLRACVCVFSMCVHDMHGYTHIIATVYSDPDSLCFDLLTVCLCHSFKGLAPLLSCSN